MNQQTQNKDQIGKGSTEIIDQPKSNIKTKVESCGDDVTSRPQSEQGQDVSSGAKEKADVQTISKDQLLEKIKSNEGVQVVNVLSPEHYGKGFIKGSKKIPLDQLDRRSSELHKTKEVVTYCASHECSASMEAAEILAAKGFKVRAYEGGIKEWVEAGLPTDK